MKTLAVLIVFLAGAAFVEPHGSITTPLARTRIQDLPNWGGAQQPFWWDSQGVWCGNVAQDVNVSNCGRCGDAPANTHANRGGRYDKGIITGTYNAGQVGAFGFRCAFLRVFQLFISVPFQFSFKIVY